MRVLRLLVIFGAPLLFAAALCRAQTGAGYKVVQKALLGGEGGWDYMVVDGLERRLFVTRGTHVSVFDVDTLKPVGEIEHTEGVHGVALAPDLGRGFTSNGRSSSITIFDFKTLKTLEEVKSTGENPDAILYDGASKRVFAFNGRSSNATVLDAATGKVVATVALGGKPEFATSDEEGRVFVNLEDRSEVVALDSRKAEVLKHWPLAPCEEPSGMAIDRAHKRLFVGCGNRLMVVVNASTGNVVASVPIGAGVDANAFDPGLALAFSSNGEGTLTVVREDSPDKFSLLENVPTQRGARTMALDEKTHRIFLVTAEFGPRPEATAAQPHPRPPILPGTFTLLVVGR